MNRKEALESILELLDAIDGARGLSRAEALQIAIASIQVEAMDQLRDSLDHAFREDNPVVCAIASLRDKF